MMKIQIPPDFPHQSALTKEKTFTQHVDHYFLDVTKQSIFKILHDVENIILKYYWRILFKNQVFWY